MISNVRHATQACPVVIQLTTFLHAVIQPTAAYFGIECTDMLQSSDHLALTGSVSPFTEAAA